MSRPNLLFVTLDEFRGDSMSCAGHPLVSTPTLDAIAAEDPTWRTEITDPAIVLHEVHAMLSWQTEHLDRNMTGMLLRNGGIGRWPAPHPDQVRTVSERQ